MIHNPRIRPRVVGPGFKLTRAKSTYVCIHMTPFSFQTIAVITDLDNLAVSACEDLVYSRFFYRLTHES